MSVAEATVYTFPMTEEITARRRERLKRAIASLQDAVAAQKVEVDEFASNIKLLKETVEGLRGSWDKYNDKVMRLDVNPLRQKSLRLAEIMDKAAYGYNS